MKPTSQVRTIAGYLWPNSPAAKSARACSAASAWRAAALLHTIVQLEPLPHRNSLFAAFVTSQYLDQSGEGIDSPYGALSDLVRKARESRLKIYDITDTLRSWRI
ncbi:hypothetical protein ACSHXN_45480 (plasmid) [Streptomyces sp. HUAS TT11]|uniref:hypothetical protein n=1 Tax=Streptomyces sp. HUAS TT11 TaxID=3447508 RepID=UPI003F65E41D